MLSWRHKDIAACAANRPKVVSVVDMDVGSIIPPTFDRKPVPALRSTHGSVIRTGRTVSARFPSRSM